MEMSNVSEPRSTQSAAAGDNKTTPPRRHSHGHQGAAVAPQPQSQLVATIISVSQPGTTPPPSNTTTTPPALRPTTVPIFQSRTDKLTPADSASAAATRPKTTGAISSKKKKDNKRYRALSEVEDLEQQGDETSPPLSPIDEQVLEEVLFSRPTLRLGREMSMRFRAQTAAIPSRRRRAYKSLPHGAKRPKTTGTLATSGVKLRGEYMYECVQVILCVYV